MGKYVIMPVDKEKRAKASKDDILIKASFRSLINVEAILNININSIKNILIFL